MNNQKVSTEDLIKSMEYLEIEVPEDLRKSLESKNLEGAEQNGGDSGANDLSKRKQEVKARLEKAKKDLEELEEEEGIKKSEDEEGVEGKEDAPEKEGKAEGEAPQKNFGGMKKSQEVDELGSIQTTLSHLTNLVKSQNSVIQSLSEEVSSFTSAPVERRSATSASFLRKSMGTDTLDGEGTSKKKGTSMSILEKGRVSEALMGAYIAGGSTDETLGASIMTYEASGYLAPAVINFMKGQGIEIETLG